MNSEVKSLHCRVRGRVQGVGFRFFIYKRARELELSGWVRNSSDGSVEIQAHGPGNKLEQLITTARTGPPGARVQSCDTTWGRPAEELITTPKPDAFTIRS